MSSDRVTYTYDIARANKKIHKLESNEEINDTEARCKGVEGLLGADVAKDINGFVYIRGIHLIRSGDFDRSFFYDGFALSAACIDPRIAGKQMNYDDDAHIWAHIDT